MSQRPKSGFLSAIVANLGWPLFWGAACWIGLYAVLSSYPTGSMVHRYLAGHPVEYIETLMFFVGLSALVLKTLWVMQQYRSLPQVRLPAVPEGGQSVDDCPHLLEWLGRLPGRVRQGYLARRIKDALTHVHARRSADDLDEHLKYLADMDHERQHDSYSLVRLVIWAIPILGFLGTVIGVTIAISNLSPEALASPSQENMTDLTEGLALAFDTTTVALSLSIVLMFAQFLTDRVETQLLGAVDGRAEEELVGRFEQFGTGTDPIVRSFERLSAQITNSSEKLVQQQAAVWSASMEDAQKRWTQLVAASEKQIEGGLATALERSLKSHAQVIRQSEREAGERNGRYVEQLRSALIQSAEVMKTQQEQLMRQGKTMSQVLDATGNIANLEKSLNENLKSLAGAKNFEDTVMSLAAAIHLLNSRLGQLDPANPVELQAGRAATAQERAA